MKRVSLELGGHAPFIVFADADPEHAAKGAALVKFLNTGQACICPNRLLVHRSIARAVRRHAASTGSASCRPGNGLERRGHRRAAHRRAPRWPRWSARSTTRSAKGASLVTGGERRSTGSTRYFYAPTLLTDVTPDMLIYREETFGPIAPVIVFDDDDEAIAMANDTDYGLASYVYTRT